MKHKQRAGFTLTEIVVSLTILSILVAGVLGFFTSSYANIFKLRENNIATNTGQQRVEAAVAELRKNGAAGRANLTLDAQLRAQAETITFSTRIGSRNISIPVSGTQLSYTGQRTTTLSAFVADERDAVLFLPAQVDVFIGDNTRKIYYLGQTTEAARYVAPTTSGAITLDIGWYLSERQLVRENLGGVDRYPAIPYLVPGDNLAINPTIELDYKEFSNPTSTVTITQDMLGKHLAYAVRPVNKGGRVGSFSSANVWVMGLPIVNDLYYHVDADSILEVLDNNDRRAITRDSSATKTDFRDMYNFPKWDGTPYTTVPVARRAELNGSIERQFIELSAGNSLNHSVPTNRAGGAMTALMLAGGPLGGNPTESEIYRATLSNSNVVVVLAQPGQFRVRVQNNAGAVVSELTPIPLDTTKDNILQFQLRNANATPVFEVSLNGSAPAALNLPGTLPANTSITVRGPMNLSELAIYRRPFTAAEMATLGNYFLNKYNTQQP